MTNIPLTTDDNKLEAAVSFASSSGNRRSIITSIDTALAGLQGKTGTIITC